MDTKQTLLYERIQAYQFDPPGTPRTFLSRLAEETGWDSQFATRAQAEYRRFAFGHGGGAPGLPF